VLKTRRAAQWGVSARPRQNALLGCGMMLLSTVFFAAMHGCVRVLSNDGIHPYEIAFFRCFFGLLMLAPWLAIRARGALRTRHLGMHVVRAALNVVAMFMFFTALGITPIAQVQALAFTAPLFTTVLAVFLLGETVRLRRWSAVAIGFVGALVIIRPGVQPLDLGSLLTVGSALVWAVCMIIIKRLSGSESALTITAYMTLLMSLISLVPASLHWVWPDGSQWLWLAACGVLGTLGQWIMTQSFRLADATVVLPLDFAKLIWGAALGWFAFGEFIDLWTWIGAVIIFSGSTYIAYRERQIERAAAAGKVVASRPSRSAG
jgi:drug/metabolite transporter (DMT)-like permease